MITLLLIAIGLAIGSIWEPRRKVKRTLWPSRYGYHPSIPDEQRIIP